MSLIRKLVLIGSCLLLGLGIGWCIGMSRKAMYEYKTVLVVRLPDSFATKAGKELDISPVNAQSLLHSPNLIRDAVGKWRLAEFELLRDQFDPVAEIRAGLEIREVDPTYKVYEVIYRSADPLTAEAICKALVSVYEDYLDTGTRRRTLETLFSSGSDDAKVVRTIERLRREAAEIRKRKAAALDSAQQMEPAIKARLDREESEINDELLNAEKTLADLQAQVREQVRSINAESPMLSVINEAGKATKIRPQLKLAMNRGALIGAVVGLLFVAGLGISKRSDSSTVDEASPHVDSTHAGATPEELAHDAQHSVENPPSRPAASTAIRPTALVLNSMPLFVGVLFGLGGACLYTQTFATEYETSAVLTLRIARDSAPGAIDWHEDLSEDVATLLRNPMFVYRAIDIGDLKSLSKFNATDDVAGEIRSKLEIRKVETSDSEFEIRYRGQDKTEVQKVCEAFVAECERFFGKAPKESDSNTLGIIAEAIDNLQRRIDSKRRNKPDVSELVKRIQQGTTKSPASGSADSIETSNPERVEEIAKLENLLTEATTMYAELRRQIDSRPPTFAVVEAPDKVVEVRRDKSATLLKGGFVGAILGLLLTIGKVSAGRAEARADA